MSTIFIAVQCIQCSIMQVKQQKKSSNKWVCAVCNQPQSFRRIHARGYLARDLRKFVQAFNLSRSVQETSSRASISSRSDEYLIRSEVGGPSSSGGTASSSGKRRMNWSEYLNRGDYELGADDGEVKQSGQDLVAELPQKAYRTVLPNYPRQKRLAASEMTASKNLSRIRDHQCQVAAIVPKTVALSLGRDFQSGASTWKMKTGEGDNPFKRDQSHFYQSGRGSKVEDEVHPDFL